MKNKWIPLFAFIAVFIVNVLATIGKINHTTPGSISNQYPIMFTPAGYAFSIWSLIYLLLLILFVWSVFDNTKFTKAAVYRSNTFVISCFFNIAWIFAWHYKVIWLSWIFIVCLLISLAILNLEIQRNRLSEKSWIENWLGVFPFQIYFGWILVATIANTCVLLYSFGFKSSFLGIGAEIWTVILILIAYILTWWITFVKQFKAIGYVFIWAVLAIAVKNYQWKMAGAEITQFASKGNLLIIIFALITIMLMIKSYMDQLFGMKCTCESLELKESKSEKKGKKR